MKSGDMITFLDNSKHVLAIVGSSVLGDDSRWYAFDAEGARYIVDENCEETRRSLQQHHNVFDNSEINLLPSREEIENLLSRNVVRVTFEKINGETRVMDCTLMEQLLPERPATTREKAKNTTNVSVWDVNASGWRSFRYNLIKEVTIL